MKVAGKKILLCDCGATMALDAKRLGDALGADAAPVVHHALCRSEIAAFEGALGADRAVIVGCTQEAPLFSEAAAGKDAKAALGFVDIRESAGWGEQGRAATPKIAALLAAAAVEAPPAPTVTLKSGGVTLVYGRDETAVEAAHQLAGRLEVTVLLDRPREVVPPRVMEVPIYRGTIARAAGHLGAFEITIDDYAPALPSARGMLAFAPPRNGATLRCDLILDLAGAPPLFAGGAKRDGYFNPDPGDPARVQRALFDMADLVGEFDKPRYVAYDAAICAHGRSGKVGCTLCLDHCPTGAIAPAGDEVAIDAQICAGCGHCASVCPTGAASYALPPAGALLARLRALLMGYHAAGGEAPVLLLHDGEAGADMIAMIGRFGRGLPANLLPFALNAVTVAGLDLLLAAQAYGAHRTAVLVGPAAREALDALNAQIEIAEAILTGLGYGAGRLSVIDEADPDAVEARLYSLAEAEKGAQKLDPGDFVPLGGKRDRFRLALDRLHARAPNPVDRLPLPAGAPFGAVNVRIEGCTLCLACVGACPTGALIDNPDKPQLRFREDACVQCGLCRATCPESVISLEPRLDFTADVRAPRLLHEEEPFQCVRCGKPFGVRASVERIVERLRDHSMFKDDERALDRIRMCEDCRVIVQFEGGQSMAAAPRPKPRTTDDYLRGDGDDEG